MGPTHPYRGGVVLHTAELVTVLGARPGVTVSLIGWRDMYPAVLYRGELAEPGDQPDHPVPPGTRLLVRWWDPLSWWRAGRRAATDGADVLVCVLVVPFHAVALVVLAHAFRRDSRRRGRPGVSVQLVAHNVLPHEPHPGAATLVRWVLSRCDGVLIHSPEQAVLARRLGARRVRTRDMPVHLPGGFPASVPERPTHDDVRLLFFGLVREYKGVDVLIRAVAAVPGCRLTVAGQLWGEAGREARRLAAEPGVAGRVDFREGYVEPGDVPGLMADHDVLVLPYRSATASVNVELAHAYGMPVVATAVGTFPTKVRDGVDGLLVSPGSVPDLAAALRRVTDPARLASLTAGVVPPSPQELWGPYVDALLDPGTEAAA